MSIFDKFRKRAREVTPDNIEAFYGGKFLDPAEFQALAKSIEEADGRVKWSVLMGGSASGRLSGPSGQESHCELRPLHDDKVEGLLLSSIILPAPSTERVDAIRRVIDKINGLIYVPMGFAVNTNIEAGVFVKTPIFKGPDGYSKTKLRSLVDANAWVSIFVTRALLSVYQGAAGEEAALQDFADEFRTFALHLPNEVQESYRWALTIRGGIARQGE